jgi:hypothetical protein
LDPFSKFFGIWMQDSWAAGYVSSRDHFLNSLEDKERRFKSVIFIAPHIEEEELKLLGA